jgi:hypothetical protein
MKPLARVLSVVFVSALFGLTSCSDDEEGDGGGTGGSAGRPDETGAACEVADDCYPDVAEGELQGDAVCIDRVRGGYCTHTCETDDDCCAAEGECADSALLEVCSPFESMEGMHCFLSCEAEDVEAATDVTDENDFCQKKASTDFGCRSSGGGADNRKICVPVDCGVGERCTDTNDCDPDLECVTSYNGGYCTRACTLDADCGDDLCVTVGDQNYCHRRCTTASDCSHCRNGDTVASCRDDVTFAQADSTGGSVCVPD